MNAVYNLGCGPPGATPLPRVFDGWRQVRVDIDPAVRPDIVASLTDLSPIASEAAAAIWASHCLEHLYPHQVVTALREMRRILRYDGVAQILVPDLQTAARLVAEDRMNEPLYEADAGPVTAHDLFYGFGPDMARGNLHMAHHCGFTPSTLLGLCQEAGFACAAVMRRPGLELAAVAVKRAWSSEAERHTLFEHLGL